MERNFIVFLRQHGRCDYTLYLLSDISLCIFFYSLVFLFNCFFFPQVEARFTDLQDALIILLSSTCNPLVSDFSVFESYANKYSLDQSRSLVDLMNFISEIRKLEANGYAVWKSHSYKKWEDNENRRKLELDMVEGEMAKVEGCENPTIARAFTTMIDHRGTFKYSSRCNKLSRSADGFISQQIKIISIQFIYRYARLWTDSLESSIWKYNLWRRWEPTCRYLYQVC